MQKNNWLEISDDIITYENGPNGYNEIWKKQLLIVKSDNSVKLVAIEGPNSMVIEEFDNIDSVVDFTYTLLNIAEEILN